MNDLIERQAAIDALEQIYCHIELIKRRPVTKGEQAMFLDMRGAIMEVPSAQPERKKGKWIEERCSECGCYVYHGDVRNFCPDCGADMREDQTDDNRPG